MSQSYCILGNPNVGKTSLFNNLTGSYEYVGNWAVSLLKESWKIKARIRNPR